MDTTHDRSRTILIVESSRSSRSKLREYLSQDRRYHYNVFEAQTGVEGLKQYRIVQPDAILLDYLLPDMNGLDFLRVLQRQIAKPDLSVVVLTEDDREQYPRPSTASGAQQYLSRSTLTTENLRCSLHNAIEQGELLRQVATLKVQNDRQLQVLNHKEEQLRLALASAQMGIWDWNLSTGQIEWNHEHEELFGLAPGSFDGNYETFDRCIHPQDRAAVHECVVRSIETHTSLCHQFRIVWADGSIHWIEARGEAYFNNAQVAVRTIGTVVNIDRRMQAQQLLQNQLDRQRLVMEMTVQIRRSLDLSEILQTTVNEVRQFLQTDRVTIYKFAPDWVATAIVESVGSGWKQILTTQISRNDIAPHLSDFQQGIVTQNADIYRVKVDTWCLVLLKSLQARANVVVPIFKGDELWGLLTAHHCSAPRQWQPSEIDLVKQLSNQLSIAIQQADLFAQAQLELTQRKQAEMTLQLLNTEMEQRQAVEALKDEFIGIVSHELRTPLTSMQGALGLLAMGVMDDEPEQMKRTIEIASIETERLVRLVNNILDLDKLGADNNFLEQEWCDAAALIQTAIDVMTGSADFAGVDLVLECPPLQIWVAPDRIVQTLTNLLGNAIKFSPANSRVSIEVAAIEQPASDRVVTALTRQIRFAVKDCGRGIPAAKLETIFNRFEQVDSSDSRDKGGTGLGLAICKSIVEQHQGRIWVESNWGHGSTFFFVLPQPMNINRSELGTL
jgi:PAS domain S-box-containing protein